MNSGRRPGIDYGDCGGAPVPRVDDYGIHLCLASILRTVLSGGGGESHRASICQNINVVG